jgi:hypothetical protein
MKLQENYFESEYLSTRAKNAIKRIIFRVCSFEELLPMEITILKRVDGIKTHEEIEKMFQQIKLKKVFEENAKKVLTINN